MKTVTFYYVRHGKTEFNDKGVIQGGRVDSPLVPETLPVIEQSARALAGIGFARCYCSPLGRAQETARLLVDGMGETGRLEVRTLDDLREFDFGEVDGKRYADFAPRFARCFVRQDFSSVGGESGRQVRARVRRAFSRMLSESADDDAVLVVAHGALFRYVLLEFAGDMGPLGRRLRSLTVRTPNAGIGVVVGCEADGERDAAAGGAGAGAGTGGVDGGSGAGGAGGVDGCGVAGAGGSPDVVRGGLGHGMSFRLVQLPLSGEDFAKTRYGEPR